MPEKIDARLHDLLKLVGRSADHMCPHYYESDLQHLKNTELWKSFSHHCVRDTEKHQERGLKCSVYPISRELFCLHYADILASSISRRLTDVGYRSRTTFHVWSHTKQPCSSEATKNRDLLKDLASIKDHSTLFSKYEHALRSRPEEIGGCPFASLYTHSLLTKKWSDFLVANAGYFGIPDPIDNVVLTNKLINEIESSKEVYLGRVQIRTDTLLVRLRDTHILTVARETLRECIKAVDGVSLYELSDNAVCVLPACDEPDKLLPLMRTKLTSNFYLELTLRKTRLPYGRGTDIENDFLDRVSQLFSEPETRNYPSLLPIIKPDPQNRASRKAIICDLCQKAPASVECGKETTEYLCEECNRLRMSALGSEKIFVWEQAGSTKIAIIRIDLDAEELLTALSDCLIMEFGDKLPAAGSGDIEPHRLGFSVIFEFFEAFKGFMAEMKDRIGSTKTWGGKERIELDNILDNLFIAKIDDLKDLISVLREYTSTYNKFFSKFINLRQSPVYLEISCANIKYPFFEHWKSIEAYKEKKRITGKRKSVWVSITGKGQMEADIWQMDGVIGFINSFSKRGNLRALHKLAEVAKFSETLADKILHDRSRKRTDDGESRVFRQLSDPSNPHGLDHNSLLTLAKILGEQ